jgi:hypothetical protein
MRNGLFFFFSLSFSFLLILPFWNQSEKFSKERSKKSISYKKRIEQEFKKSKMYLWKLKTIYPKYVLR